MSTENLEQEDQNRTTEPIIDIPGNEAPADPEQEIVSQGVHNYSAAETYVCPTDPAVLQQLEWFRDQKLALMMHFGLYCQPGMVASWALSDKDSEDVYKRQRYNSRFHRQSGYAYDYRYHRGTCHGNDCQHRAGRRRKR